MRERLGRRCGCVLASLEEVALPTGHHGVDRWSVYYSAEKRIAALGWKGIERELLPAYAPELIPVEAMRSQT